MKLSSILQSWATLSPRESYQVWLILRHFPCPSNQALDKAEVLGSLATPLSLRKDPLWLLPELFSRETTQGCFLLPKLWQLRKHRRAAALNPQSTFLSSVQVLTLKSSPSLASPLWSSSPTVAPATLATCAASSHFLLPLSGLLFPSLSLWLVSFECYSIIYARLSSDDSDWIAAPLHPSLIPSQFNQSYCHHLTVM